MSGLAFAGLLLGSQAVLAAAGQILRYRTVGDSLLGQLRPGLPWSTILAVGGAGGLAAAALVVGLHRFVPGYARAVRPAVDLILRLPRGWLWAASLVAPFGEELFFRGALQPAIGLVGAAAVFGLLHTGFRREHWAYGLTAGAAGVLLGWTYQFLGELWAPVAAHALYNVLVLLSLPLRPLTWDGSFGIMNVAAGAGRRGAKRMRP